MTKWLLTPFLALAACIVPTQPQQPAGGGGYSEPTGGSAEGGGYTAPADSGGAAVEEAPPAAPSVVSVTLRSSCSSTVRIFFGQKPKFGSGTYSTLSGNSRTNHQFRPGDMVWIVDQSDNGVASATVDDRTSEIEVTSSCTGFSVR